MQADIYDCLIIYVLTLFFHTFLNTHKTAHFYMILYNLVYMFVCICVCVCMVLVRADAKNLWLQQNDGITRWFVVVFIPFSACIVPLCRVGKSTLEIIYDCREFLIWQKGGEGNDDGDRWTKRTNGQTEASQPVDTINHNHFCEHEFESILLLLSSHVVGTLACIFHFFSAL